LKIVSNFDIRISNFYGLKYTVIVYYYDVM
jgi:hypothetical protein